MNTPGITRRRALALGAAGGVSGLLRGTPAWGLPGGEGAAGVRSRGLSLPAGAVPADGRAGPVIRTGAAFDLVGLRGVDLRGAHVEIRVRRGGGWSPWVPLGAGVDHAPDVPRAAPASDPVWAGGADALQLRAGRALRGGRLQLITAPPSPGAAARTRRSLRTTGEADASTRQAGAPPPIIPRAQWGADGVPPRAAPSYGAVRLAFVHHTVSANAYQPADSARMVLSIAKYHRDSNGWNDIGYNFLVDRFGQIFEGRAGGIDQAVIGAQAGGWNSQSTGIATLGDFGQAALPEEALAALARLIAWKLMLHGVPTSGTVALLSGGGKENRYPYGQQVVLARVSGHRDGCTTECPGAVLYGQLDDLRRRVAGIGPVLTTPASATLIAAAASVPFGEDAVLTGQVLGGDGTPVANVPVSIQKRTPSGRWVRVGVASTTPGGTYDARVPWTRAAPLRAVAQVLPGGAAGRVRSGELQIALAPVLAVTAPGVRSRVLAGQAVAMQGMVGPEGPVRVRVERQVSGGRWAPAGEVRATVRKTAFTVAVPLRRPGLYRLTALAGASGASASVFVRAVRHATSVPGVSAAPA